MSIVWPKYLSNFSRITAVSLLICLLLNSSSLFSQNIDNLHIEKVQGDGLTNDYVVCINQDANGFMWFGTREGLFRYDGYNFKAFKNLPGDSTSLVNNAIVTLYSEKNKLWVGTLGGITSIDVNTLNIKNFHPNEPLQAYAIHPKNDSILWVGASSGLFQFNKKNFRWKRAPGLDSNIFVSSISDDHHDHLYITKTNGFYAYTKSTGLWKKYPDAKGYFKISKNKPTAYCKSVVDHSGNLWMTTWGAGLVKFNIITGEINTWSSGTNDVSIPPYKIGQGIIEDTFGNIWTANVEAGLTIFNPSKNKFTNYPIDWKSENKFSGAVEALFRDRAGTYWIGTAAGIYKYDPFKIYLSKKILLWKVGKSLAQPYNSPGVMFTDRDSSLWIGMYDGLFIADQKTGVLTDVNKAIGLPPNLPVFTIKQDKTGAIWCNERNRLIKISKKKGPAGYATRSQIFASPDISTNIVSIYIDPSNRIWIGTSGNGIYKFDQVAKKFISCHYEERDSRSKINQVRSFCEIAPDSLLFVGENTGLVLFHPQTGRFEHVRWPGVTNLTDINVIYRNHNDIWIGTENKGLWQTDVQLKKPWIVTVNDGLPSDDIASIAVDNQGNVWSLTNSGAAELHMPDKKIFVFDKKDGIQNLDGLYSIIADNKGNVSIGGRGCIYSINPASILKNTQPPKVRITDMKVFDKVFDISSGETIHLNYNQNYFSFEYVALNYTQSKLNRYAYKMDGLDTKWNDAGSRRYVSYANLDEGTYVFNVKASNNEGVWNNVPARLVIVITPPFWHTWWFYLTLVLVFSALLYTLYMYNINQLKIRLQMRDKIASDLHDDIGSTLSGINIFSKIALQQMAPGQPGVDLMEKISERSKKTMDALSDIVWSINTRNDGMDNFLMKANEYLTVLEVQDIGFDFIVDEEIHHLKIGMVQKRELYLIFKEAVCNASKYADCSFVQIYLKRQKDTCTLIVKDNGKGFDTSVDRPGNGLYNMRQRAKKMNAELHIDSEENIGTTITLNFRITRFR